MSILAVLIPISLVLLGLAVGAFIWAVKRGQFDDLETPAIEILADESTPPAEPREPHKEPESQTAPARSSNDAD